MAHISSYSSLQYAVDLSEVALMASLIFARGPSNMTPHSTYTHSHPNERDVVQVNNFQAATPETMPGNASSTITAHCGSTLPLPPPKPLRHRRVPAVYQPNAQADRRRVSIELNFKDLQRSCTVWKQQYMLTCDVPGCVQQFLLRTQLRRHLNNAHGIYEGVCITSNIRLPLTEWFAQHTSVPL